MGDVAKGTTLSWGGTTVGEITSFTGPGFAHAAVDITDLDDTVKAFLPAGVYDPGEVSLDLNFDEDDAAHTVLVADVKTGTTRVLIVQFQNGTAATGEWSCNAFLTSFEPSGTLEDKLAASCAFKCTGDVTVT